MRNLYAQFGDWSLALAAYNAGADRVAATLARGTRQDFGYSGASSRLPIEAQQYVPAVVNAIGVIRRNNQPTGQQARDEATSLYATAKVED